ncbi:MAG: hypothetical protein Q9163_000535 [Psora crenata]
MRLSFFPVVLSFVAAGSNAIPLRVDKRDCVKRQANGTSPVVPINAQNSPSSGPAQDGVNALNNVQGGIVPANFAASDSSGPGGQGSCPGFRNVVFNTGAPTMAGWPQTTWGSLAKHGVDKWIGFSLDTIDKKLTYNVGSVPAATTPDFNARQINVAMDPNDVTAALELLKTNPPAYLELYNEPDYSFQGLTPMTDAIAAAEQLQPFFDMEHPQTTYISPGLAYANSQWLKDFRDHCKNCFEQIPIISQHIYSPDAAFVVDEVKKLHETFPDKKIWITELSPATPDCLLDRAGVINWMNQVVRDIQALGYVEKIFWNSGEHGTAANSMAAGSCNPSLTNPDGSPTDLLLAYGQLCGGGAPVTDPSATS